MKLQGGIPNSGGRQASERDGTVLRYSFEAM